MIAKGRFVLLLVLLTSVVLVACGGDDDDDAESTPTDLAIQVTSTPTEVAETPTDVPATATPIEESTATPSPTATAPEPTATEAEATATATTAATSAPIDQEAGSNLLSLMPFLEELPAGLVQTEEVIVGIDEVAADGEDPAARKAQLEEWGFVVAARRTFESESETIAADTIALISEVGMRLATPEFASAQLQHDYDKLTTTSGVEFMPFDTQPVGDESRAALGQSEVEGLPVQVGSLWVRKGGDVFRLGAIGGTDIDIIAQLTSVASQVFDVEPANDASLPAIGDLIYSTNFEDWNEGTFDSGSISIVDGVYRMSVNPPSGSYVSAFTVNSDQFADLSISAQVRQNAGPPLADGCVMLRVDPDNQNWDYAFCVSGSGYVSFIYEEFLEDGSYHFETLFETILEDGINLNDWHSLQVIASGENFWLLIDDVVVGTVHNVGPMSGEVGVVVNNFAEEIVEFDFQNLQVFTLQ